MHDTGFYSAVWYRRLFDKPQLSSRHRLLLHFEAVDYAASVWLNGSKVGTHEDGYTPFDFDITESLSEETSQVLVLRAEDDPADLAKPRGKQDWKLEPHSIWYPRTTGIWQTVWLEIVPGPHVHSLAWSSSLDRWDIGLDAVRTGTSEKLTMHVQLTVGD